MMYTAERSFINEYFLLSHVPLKMTHVQTAHLAMICVVHVMIHLASSVYGEPDELHG